MREKKGSIGEIDDILGLWIIGTYLSTDHHIHIDTAQQSCEDQADHKDKKLQQSDKHMTL